MPPPLSSSNISTQKTSRSNKTVNQILEEDDIRHHRIIVLILNMVKIAIGLILLVAIIFFIWTQFRPAVKTHRSVKVTIKSGQGVKEIASILSDKQVLNSKLVFLIYVKIHHGALLPGDYIFTQNETTSDIYKQLVKGVTTEVKITVPEGWRREQIAQLLNMRGITSYEAFMEASDGKEGMLFPDTYLLPEKVTASEIVTKMVDNYNLKTKDLQVTQEQLIMASIVEREAKRDADRPKIAGVFYNRLKMGMKLQSDVTVSYAVDDVNLASVTTDQIDDYKFWPAISASQIQSTDSDYNTYQIKGLPIAPISNPGLKSLEAAVKPAQTNDLYFLSTESGVTYYAQTLQQHNRNIAQYAN